MKRWRLIFLGLLLALVTSLAAPAFAHMGHERFTLEGRKRPTEPKAGPRGHALMVTRGPLQLVREGDLYRGTFELKNDGDGPLEIYRVNLDPDEDLQRAPDGLLVTSSDREAKPLAPGETRPYTVSWRTDQTLASQVECFVQIDSDSAASGAKSFDPPLKLGVVADRRPVWQRHLLLVVALGPLLLCLLALASRFVRALSERVLARVATGAAGLLVPVAFLPVTSFVRVLGREDGALGFQHIERLGGAGAGLMLAVDGLSVGFVPLAAMALFAAVSASRAPRIGTARFVFFAGAAASGATLFIVSQDLLLSVAALGLMVVALSSLLFFGARAGGARPGPVGSALVASGIGAGAFAWLAHVLAHSAVPTRAFDGSTPTLATSVPELVRASAEGRVFPEGVAALFGLPTGVGLGVLALVSAAALVGVAPLHGWQARLAREHDAGVMALLGALTASSAGYLVLRFVVGLFRDAAQTLAPVLSLWGAAIVLVAAVLSWLERDLRALVGHLSVTLHGLALVALGTLTPQGIQAALAIWVARPLALALAQLATGRLVAWSGEGDVVKQSGVAQAAPRLALVWVVGVATLGPVGPAALGFLLLIVGVIGRDPAQAALLLALFACVGVGVARLLRPLAGKAPLWWRDSTSLVAQGGTLPDLDRRELVWASALALALFLLMVAPRFWIGGAARAILDLYLLLEPSGPTQVS